MFKIKVLNVIVFLFVFLFMYAAASKLLTFDLFQAQIGKSPLIMRQSKIVSYAVPIVEIIVSLMLVIPRTLIYGLYASFFLMFIFSAYITFILTFSPYVPCSCGGILESMGWAEHLIFNICFVLLSVLGVILYNAQKRNQFRAKTNSA